jgi:hypothetical protein
MRRMIPPPRQVVQLLLVVMLNVILFALCVRAIRLRAGTHRAFMWWASAYLAWVAVNFAMNVARWAGLSGAGTGADPAMFRYLLLSQGVQAALLCVYPVAVLILMRRPLVRAAFDPGARPDTTAFHERGRPT